MRDEVEARPLAPVRFKGISREIIPYQVIGIRQGQDPGLEVPTDDGGLVRIVPAWLDPTTRARLGAALGD